MNVSCRDRREGVAILSIAMILVIVSLLSISAITGSGRESQSASSARAATRTLHAADAGLQIAIAHLAVHPPNLTPIDQTLDNVSIQSRLRTQTVAQPIEQIAVGRESAGSSSVNVDSGVVSVERIYLLTVTASSASSTSEVEAKINRVDFEGAGY